MYYRNFTRKWKKLDDVVPPVNRSMIFYQIGDTRRHKTFVYQGKIDGNHLFKMATSLNIETGEYNTEDSVFVLIRSPIKALVNLKPARS